jgi:hypothetical protein
MPRAPGAITCSAHCSAPTPIETPAPVTGAQDCHSPLQMLSHLEVYDDKGNLTSLNITGSFLAHGYFFIPLTGVPYFPDTLRLQSGDMNDEYTDAKIDKHVAANMKMAKSVRNGHFDNAKLDVFRWLTPDGVAHDPLIDEEPLGSVPLQPLQWRRKTAHSVEIVITQSDAACSNVPNATLDASATAASSDTIPPTEVTDLPTATSLDEVATPMDTTEPAESVAPGTLESNSGTPSAPTAAELLRQVVSRAPVTTGGDADMDVAPSADDIALRCAIARNESDSREQIITKTMEYVKKAEAV